MLEIINTEMDNQHQVMDSRHELIPNITHYKRDGLY